MTGGERGAESLLGRVRLHAGERPDGVAYRDALGKTMSYGMLARKIAGLAERFQRELEPDAVIVLSAANCLNHAAVFLAAVASGRTIFPISAEAAEAELARAAQEAGAGAFVGDERTVAFGRRRGKFALGIEDDLPESGGDFAEGRAGRLLLLSSGTTDVPKIVMRSGASLDAAARAMVRAIGFNSDDRVLLTIPLTHSYGMEHGLLAPLWAGSEVILCQNLSLPVVVPLLREGGVTILPGVPSTFEILARLPGEEMSMGRLRLAYSAGAGLPAAVYRKFLDRYRLAVTQLYGATEIGSVAYHPPADLAPESVGYAMEGVSISILNVDGSGGVAAMGDEGEIAVRAESMFDGYLSGDAELADGRFRTGDLGRLDAEGRLFVTGRLKLLIDVGGFKVNPLEVESVIQEHASVGGCVVAAVRQSDTVNRLKAVVIPRQRDVEVPIEELRALARSRLAAYKVPRQFEIRSELPRSATGKVLRHLLGET